MAVPETELHLWWKEAIIYQVSELVPNLLEFHVTFYNVRSIPRPSKIQLGMDEETSKVLLQR